MKTPITKRFADTLAPEFEKTKKELKGIVQKDEDVLSYILSLRMQKNSLRKEKRKLQPRFLILL
jgi:oxaloacetate decarboxylase alpha subunit